ncbi:PAS domain-containing sensor histidine kinase [Desulfovibrio psychrotolerans]|uniref:histidine kinase n=1 Tax=Desulfovibrio psychrotolerans TaxID=415242 RepID=A0A7J0BTP0_9BACT|nr:ATP-binding protein [Desulfovibrio psychrotolerans]GFM37083.1 hypothetical protein DSM19430T_17670 [Desulfovibrio psychrotolerans]
MRRLFINNRTRLWALSVCTGILLAAGGGLFWWSARVLEVHAPLVDAAMEVRLEAARAEIAFSRAMVEHPAEALDEARKFLDDSAWYVDAMRHGGSNEEGRFIPADIRGLSDVLDAVQGELENYRLALTCEWGNAIAGTGDDSGAHAAYLENCDRLPTAAGDILPLRTEFFDRLMLHADAAESLVQGSIAAQVRQMRLLRWGLVAYALVVGLGFTLLLQRELGAREEESRRLSERESQLSSVLQAVPVGIGLVRGRRVLQVNEPFLRMTGYTREEVEGQSTRMFYFSDEDFLNVGRSLYKTGGGMFATQMRRRDGTGIDVLLGASILKPSAVVDGQSLAGEAFSFAVLDISQAKAAERERELLGTLLADIMDSMPCALVGVNGQGVITLWNRAAERFAPGAATHGPSVAGKVLRNVIPELAFLNVGSMVNSGQQVPDIHRKIEWHSSPEIRHADVIMFPLHSGGESKAVVLIDDVTERTRLEEMLVQSEKMMSVGGLAAGVAHEINNPLGIILQSVQNVVRRFSTDIEANREVAERCNVDLAAVNSYMAERKIFDYLGAIRTAGTRAGDIVSSMLDFSRKSDTSFAPHHLGEMLDAVIELAANDYDLSLRYDFRKVDVVREYDPDVPAVRCNRLEIEQVFLNLVKNAAHAMLHVEFPRLVLRVTRDGGDAVVMVEDNGHGVEEHVRRRFFEPFFTTKPVGAGTGLGLSVSYFIIAQHHGGEMFVESAPGRGTRFTIRLPVYGVMPGGQPL